MISFSQSNSPETSTQNSASGASPSTSPSSWIDQFNAARKPKNSYDLASKFEEQQMSPLEHLQLEIPKSRESQAQEFSIGRKILSAVSAVSGGIHSYDSLTGTGRDQRLADTRKVAMYLIHDHTALSASDIGLLLGGRNQGPILRGIAKIKLVLDGKVRLRAHRERRIRTLLRRTNEVLRGEVLRD